MQGGKALAGVALLLGLSLRVEAEAGELEWSCPERPNCLSSRSADPGHRVAPLRFECSADEARRHLIGILEGMTRCRVTLAGESVITAEFTSALLRFVDDVQFQIDPQRRSIDVRSASRTGISDFGVNRRRVEEIRERFEGAARIVPDPPASVSGSGRPGQEKR